MTELSLWERCAPAWLLAEQERRAAATASVEYLRVVNDAAERTLGTDYSTVPSLAAYAYRHSVDKLNDAECVVQERCEAVGLPHEEAAAPLLEALQRLQRLREELEAAARLLGGKNA